MKLARWLAIAGLVALAGRANPAQASVSWTNPNFDGLEDYVGSALTSFSIGGWKFQSDPNTTWQLEKPGGVSANGQYLRLDKTDDAATHLTTTSDPITVKGLEGGTIGGWYFVQPSSGGVNVAIYGAKPDNTPDYTNLVFSLTDGPSTNPTEHEVGWSYPPAWVSGTYWQPWSAHLAGNNTTDTKYVLQYTFQYNGDAGTSALFGVDHTPEPATLFMLGMGLVGGLAGKRRRRAA